MTAAFQELIKNAKLTKKERLIADYVLNNFRDLCFMTSTELANTLSVSHSSVMRFTKDLGFSGYTEFAYKKGEKFYFSRKGRGNGRMSGGQNPLPHCPAFSLESI